MHTLHDIQGNLVQPVVFTGDGTICQSEYHDGWGINERRSQLDHDTFTCLDARFGHLTETIDQQHRTIFQCTCVTCQNNHHAHWFLMDFRNTHGDFRVPNWQPPDATTRVCQNCNQEIHPAPGQGLPETRTREIVGTPEDEALREAEEGAEEDDPDQEF